MSETERDHVRVRATIVTIIIVALGVAVIEAALAGRGAGSALWILAAATAVFAISLVPALRLNARGHRPRAVIWTCIAILGIQTMYLISYPRAYPAVALASVVVVALALSFVHGRALFGLTVASWVVANAAILYGVLARGLLDVPAMADVPVLLGTGIAAVTVAMVLLWQFGAHMTGALTDARAANEELASAHARLQELDRLKSRFINSAAHELNTPLTPVMVELRLLKASHPDEKQTHSLQVLERNFNRIVGLVREMLDVARLEAGRMAIRSERVDLGAVVAGVVGDFADVARARGITLASGAMDIQIVGDGRRVAQILGHLLDNAVRLTPQGGSVTVDVDRSEERARIRVTDTGVGLTEKQIEALFDAFSAVHDEPLAGAGPGMGLYIARGLVKEMGGEIGVTSRGPGHGATFVIHLPLASPVDGPPAGAGPGVAE